MKSTIIVHGLHKTLGVTFAVAVAGSLYVDRVEAAPVLNGALKEQAEFLCKRTEFNASEIRMLQKGAEFPTLLAYALEKCPNVGAVLSDGATASIAAPLAPNNEDRDRTREREPEEREKEGI